MARHPHGAQLKSLARSTGCSPTAPSPALPLAGFPSAARRRKAISPSSPTSRCSPAGSACTYEQLVDHLDPVHQPRAAARCRAGAARASRSRTLKALKDGTISDAAFDALLPVGLDPGTTYGGDVKAWIADDANYPRIMGLVNDRGPRRADDPAPPISSSSAHADPDMAANALLAARARPPAAVHPPVAGLGWTIEQTDKAIAALYRAAAAQRRGRGRRPGAGLDAGFLTLLPRLGVLTHG